MIAALDFGFWLLGLKKNLNENQLGFYIRYRLFLHYGWFLQNLEKGFIRTNMHTTVIMQEPNYRKSWNVKKHQGYNYMQEATTEA